jgi:hypothetical protein
MADEEVVTSTATVEGIQETTPVKKPDRSGWIPREQFDQLTQTVTELANIIKSQNKPEVKKEETRILTRADLRVAVEKQQLTQEEADNVWDRQLLEQAKLAAREEASSQLSVSQSTQRVDADLRKYRSIVPNAWKEGTEERSKVAAEFNELLGMGQPNSRETELLAMRTVFGPVEKLESRSKPSVESDEQAAGAGSAERKSTDLVKGLDARRKSFYEKQIEIGRYKDWGEVRKELEDYSKRKLA